jgi:hypothetical protein
MSVVNEAQVLRKEINSMLGPKNSVDFNDDWHGPMGILYDVFYSGGSLKLEESNYERKHIDYILKYGFVSALSSGFEITQKGVEYLSVYMASLERKLVDMGYKLNRKFEVDVLSGAGFKTKPQ